MSVTAAADLVCVHGPGIFDSNKNPNGDVSNATVIRRRKLFSTQMSDEIDMPSENSLTFEVVVDTLADVLDEEVGFLTENRGRCVFSVLLLFQVFRFAVPSREGVAEIDDVWGGKVVLFGLQAVAQMVC